jgi:hypothetical protein
MESHLFWGKNAPLVSLNGLVLLVIATGRVSFAIVAALALAWVYVFTMAAAKLGGDHFPQWGRNAVLLFIAAFASGVFLLVLWIVSPVLAMECSLFLFFMPAIFMASGLYERMLKYDMGEVLSQSLAEALIMGVLMVAFSLIREPLGFGSVSFPGFDLIRFINEPIRILQASSGAFIILGYGIALYRRFRNQVIRSEED